MTSPRLPPEPPKDLETLESYLSEPTPGVRDALGAIEGDILILGVAGKMGPSLARMARRASTDTRRNRRIIGVARFSNPRLEAELRANGIETRRCNLLDEAAVAALPDAPNIVFMAGRKFGATGDEPTTWATNCHLPALVCRRFPQSRIVAFSTGNVYGLSPVALGGSIETDPPQPVGEYAMSCLGRERIFEHFSRVRSIPMTILRLNYACELRYGVLVDLAQRVRNRDPVDLTMGHFNTIWQGDANAMALQALNQVSIPPAILNITGPELLSVRATCEKLGPLWDTSPVFHGKEATTALLSNAQRAHRLFGLPHMGIDQLLRWVAHWLDHDGETFGKPTHFESRTGLF